MSITGDTANHDQFVHFADVCALFPTRLDRPRLILALHDVWETDDRDTVFQKQSLFTLDGPVHLLSPTSASPPLQEIM